MQCVLKINKGYYLLLGYNKKYGTIAMQCIPNILIVGHDQKFMFGEKVLY